MLYYMFKKGDINKLLKNKIVYYAVLVASFLHLVGYMSNRNIDAILFFVAVGLLSTFFSKNKVVNMLIAIIATNLMFVGSFLREGLVEGGPLDKKGKKRKKRRRHKFTKQAEGHRHQVESLVGGEKDDEEEGDEEFSKMSIPTSQPKSLSGDESEGGRVDYASTMEQAYDNLQNILGSSGMKGLTKETEKLVKQQQNLVSSLDSMSPALQSAQETMKMFGESMPQLQALTQSMVGSNKKK